MPETPQSQAERIPQTDPATISRIIGIIATYPENELMYPARIAQYADTSNSTTERVIRRLVSENLLTEGEYIRWGKRGRPPREIHTTPRFAEAVEEIPEWRRAAQIRELMIASGKTEGEVLDYALELCRQSLLGHRDVESEGP